MFYFGSRLRNKTKITFLRKEKKREYGRVQIWWGK